jgi:hypothetical protein
MAVSYAQRAVNFQYFKHRFASRQMQCQGRFNPWFAAGFPGLIIDRPMNAEHILISGMPLEQQLNSLDIQPVDGLEITRGTLLRQMVPTQFLGCCVQLTHSLSQTGGSTSYAFAQARVHREETEYLGVDRADLNKKIGMAYRGYPVAALPSRAPKAKKRGPRGGKILSVEDVTSQYSGAYLPVYGSRPKTDGVSILEVKVGSSPSPDSTETYGAYKITEEYTRRARVQVDLPIEDAVRPPWIWDGYTNLKVGDTYMQFFGTNSITDIEGYTSDDGLVSRLGADSQEALQETQEGIVYGAHKGVGGQGSEWGVVTGKAQDNPRKNNADKAGSQQEEISKKIGSDTIVAMENDRTIEASIDYLVRVYSFIKYYGLDTGDFLRNYTWRPVVTLPEIMGSVKFDIIERSKTSQNVANDDFDPFALEDNSDLFDSPPAATEGDLAIIGREGFHSRAFGDKSDLFGLVDPQVDEILGLSKDKKHDVARRLDVRGLRRKVIWQYVQELTESRGLLG